MIELQEKAVLSSSPSLVEKIEMPLSAKASSMFAALGLSDRVVNAAAGLTFVMGHQRVPFSELG